MSIGIEPPDLNLGASLPIKPFGFPPNWPHARLRRPGSMGSRCRTPRREKHRSVPRPGKRRGGGLGNWRGASKKTGDRASASPLAPSRPVIKRSTLSSVDYFVPELAPLSDQRVIFQTTFSSHRQIRSVRNTSKRDTRQTKELGISSLSGKSFGLADPSQISSANLLQGGL